MKRTIFFILVFLFVAGSAHAGQVKMATMMDGGTAVAAGHAYSPTYVSLDFQKDGYFAVQGRIQGSGTAKVEYWVSADGTTYREPQNGSDIVSGFTATSGPLSDGRFYAQFSPDFCQFLMIVVTETGGVSTITPTIYLLYK